MIFCYSASYRFYWYIYLFWSYCFSMHVAFYALLCWMCICFHSGQNHSLLLCGNAFMFQIGMPNVFEITQWRSVDGRTICRTIGACLGKEHVYKIPIVISMCIISWAAPIPWCKTASGFGRSVFVLSLIIEMVGVPFIFAENRRVNRASREGEK